MTQPSDLLNDDMNPEPENSEAHPKAEILEDGIAPTRSSGSLVPIGITIGLALFSLILVLAGYGFRLAFGDSLNEVINHAVVVVPAFVIGIPLLFWLGSLVMNKLTGSNIQLRNALSLGWLTACVAILWLMGTYS